MVDADTLSLWLTEVQQAGFPLQRLRYPNEKKVTFQIPLPMALPLLRFLRQQGVRAKVIRREGLPFLGQRLWRRKFFCCSAVLSCTALWGIFSIVWSIDIEGDTSIPPAYLRALLHREGVYVGQFRHNLAEPQKMLQRIQLQLPGAAWIGMRLEGVGAVVTVVEKRHVKDEPARDAPILDTQGDIVAKRSALVTEILTERGTPLAEVQDTVVAGQTLISGAYTSTPDSVGQPSGTNVWVGARGRVMGEVWYTSQVEVPLRMERSVYTGRVKTRILPYLVQQLFRWPSWESGYQQQSVRQRLQPVYLGPWELPLGWVEEEYWEIAPQVKQLTLAEAVQVGREQARAAVQGAVGSEGKVLNGKVLHQRVERGKVVLSMHFDALENIAVAQS